jgi:hypothetical protein
MALVRVHLDGQRGTIEHRGATHIEVDGRDNLIVGRAGAANQVGKADAIHAAGTWTRAEVED